MMSGGKPPFLTETFSRLNDFLVVELNDDKRG
jgi:hypothetical protein